MLTGQETGVLHFPSSTHDPSGQGKEVRVGTVEGSVGQALTVAAQVESMQRTGVAAGQMNDRGHSSCEGTHRVPAPARGHEKDSEGHTVGGMVESTFLHRLSSLPVTRLHT